MFKIRIVKRLNPPKYHAFLVPILSVVISLMIMGLFLWARFGKFEKVVEAYREMFSWPFIFDYGLPDTISKMVPLLLAGLGLSVVFKMKIWNIGAEGQLYLGAMATTWGALFLFKNVENSLILIPTLLLMGAIAGALWAFIPGILKAYLKLDEIVATLMLNYIAAHWLNYLIYGPWKDPEGYNFPLTAIFPESSWLPMFGESGIHSGVLIALAMVVLIYFLMYRTRWGFHLKIIGDNQTAARYSGINVEKNLILAMILSGALAGLAGGIQMLGVQHRLQHGFSPGYGYTAIIIAWLARLNPWAMIVVAFLFGGLMVGSEQLQIMMRIPISMVYVLQGIVLFTLLASEMIFNYRIEILIPRNGGERSWR